MVCQEACDLSERDGGGRDPAGRRGTAAGRPLASAFMSAVAVQDGQWAVTMTPYLLAYVVGDANDTVCHKECLEMALAENHAKHGRYSRRWLEWETMQVK
jgi:hypothetical protein